MNDTTLNNDYIERCEEGIVVCQYCKSEIAEGAAFCPSCGKGLTLKKVSTGLLVAGWIFSVLGGIIGLAISSSIAYGKKYDTESKQKGKIMNVAAIICCVVWLIVRFSITQR